MTLSKPDFDFSKYVEVPDAWIENALNIPKTVQKKPKVIPMRRIVTAASIVLVAVMGITLYFLFGNKAPIPVAPKQTVATEVQSVDMTDATSPTDHSSIQNTDRTVNYQAATSSQTITPTSATQSATDNRAIIVTPTSSPTNGATAVPVPTISPASEPPQDVPTNVLRPVPTQQPITDPTTAPSPASAPITEKTTQAYIPDIKTLSLVLPFAEAVTASEDADGTLYCCVYDSAGNPLGDSDLYSRSHWIDVTTVSSGYASDSVEYRYSVEYDANQVPDNRFTYKIYLRNGTVLKTGTVEG